ncbi:hypothetical protein [Sideroxydans sp.]
MFRNNRNSKTLSKETKASLIFSGLIAWLLIGAFVIGQLEVKPTRLILQHDGCTLMQRIGTQVKLSTDGATCEVNLPFRPNLLNTGGRVHIDGNPFTLSEHQIIAYKVLTDQPYTPYQLKLIYLFVGASVLLLLLPFSDKLFASKE